MLRGTVCDVGEGRSQVSCMQGMNPMTTAHKLPASTDIYFAFFLKEKGTGIEEWKRWVLLEERGTSVFSSEDRI